MAILHRADRLKKDLGLLDVYAISTATALSGGLFLLPGIAYAEAGPAVVLSYVAATIPLIPALLSMVELSTAMPRSGGFYYFLDRSMGPLMGTIGGLGTWIALMLKTAFAILGIGLYLQLLIPRVPVTVIAIGAAVLFGIINLLGAKKTGLFQIVLAAGLLAILGWFDGVGVAHVDWGRFDAPFDMGAMWRTAGLVYVSFVGLTKIVSVSEEVRDPERTLPGGIFLSFGTVIIVYVAAIAVMVGTVDPATLSGNLTPVAAAADQIGGKPAVIFVSVAAILSFLAVANAGILSASRYPLAMSRDHLMPRFLLRLNSHKTPDVAIGATVGVIVLSLLLFDPSIIAELASAFLLLVFAINCLAVIVMRESHIESYDPGFRSPLYPWTQIFGVISSLVFIIVMGPLAIVVVLGFLAFGATWYVFYARDRVGRTGAIYHVFRRIGERLSRLGTDLYDVGLDRELRGILKEKGLREQDPFDELVAEAEVLDLNRETDTFSVVAEMAAERLSVKLRTNSRELYEGFMQGTLIGMTPVSEGVSLPHLRLVGLRHPVLLLVRSKSGVEAEILDVYGGHSPIHRIHAFFFLVSSEDEPKQHLRILANIAERVDEDDFTEAWLKAENEQEIKEILLREERYLSLQVSSEGPTSQLVGHSLQELRFPEGVIVALIRRQGEIIIPRGRTTVERGDRLTILGEPANVRRLKREYVEVA